MYCTVAEVVAQFLVGGCGESGKQRAESGADNGSAVGGEQVSGRRYEEPAGVALTLVRKSVSIGGAWCGRVSVLPAYGLCIGTNPCTKSPEAAQEWPQLGFWHEICANNGIAVARLPLSAVGLAVVYCKTSCGGCR
jgi:hypothetical protein